MKEWPEATKTNLQDRKFLIQLANACIKPRKLRMYMTVIANNGLRALS